MTFQYSPNKDYGWFSHNLCWNKNMKYEKKKIGNKNERKKIGNKNAENNLLYYLKGNNK